MTIKTSAFVGISLDGFLARADGRLDWLLAADQQGVDHGYDAFIETIDVIVMGRKTYDAIEQFDEWPYGNRRVFVLSSSQKLGISSRWKDHITVVNTPIPALLDDLEHGGSRHAYVDGGSVIQALIEADRLDEITITTVPVLIGSGISLFGQLKRDIQLELIHATSYSDGMTQSVYRFIHQAAPGSNR